MPGHLHGDALGNAVAHQVSYGSPSQVVWNPTGTARLVHAARNALMNVVIRLPFTLRFDLLKTHGQMRPRP